ncbi:hypothetical protein Tco_1265242 [Tanacetum coccineum]
MWLKKCTQKPQVKALIFSAVMTVVFPALPNQKIFKKDDIFKLSRKRHAKTQGIDSLISKKLPPDVADDMIREVSDEEIKKAMFSIDGNKAPGLDGFSLCFFKKAWSIVGSDVCKAVRDFFKNGKILKEINSTMKNKSTYQNPFIQLLGGEDEEDSGECGENGGKNDSDNGGKNGGYQW